MSLQFDTNDLRALAGIILLLLALCVLFLNDENEIINYLLLALAGFLVGGQLLNRNNKS
jgi:hypothetical protein